MTNRRPRAMFESLETRNLLSTFVVDTTIDESDGDFGGGDFSLREAIEQANANPGEDTITFSAALSDGTIALNSGELRISDALTISGLGTDHLTVSGADSSRVFNVDDGNAGAAINVAISGLTLTHGPENTILNSEALTLTGVRVTAGNSTSGGGGLLNNGSAVLNSCTFDHNSTIGEGGAIKSGAGSTLNIVNSAFNDNSATGDGGGIWNDGTAAITGTNFTHNTANLTGGGGGSICTDVGSTLVMNGGTVKNSEAFKGGGVLVNGTGSLFNVWITGNHAPAGGGGIASFLNGSVTVDGSTISANTTDASGGGIAARGPLTVRNSTISGNAARDSGGGIQLVDSTATVTNSTIYGNGDVIGEGGGILVQNTVLTLVSSIVAFNAFGQNPALSEIALSDGGSLSAGSTNNLIGHTNSAGGLVNGVSGNIVGADPRLTVLRNNGGNTPTHSPLPTSPAIDAGANPANLTTDQRGFARVGGAAPDIGAYETRVYPTDTGPGHRVVGAADSSNVHRVATINRDGDLIVFQQGGSSVNLQEATGAPKPTGDPVIYVDPKDGLTYVGAPSADGLILYTRAAGGVWSFRNLTTETNAPASPAGNLTQFTSIGGIVVLAGTTADGKLVGFQQTLHTAPAGGPAFAFVDISAQVVANGGTSPQLTNLISYVPAWDAWHLAGIDQNGHVQSVWLHIPGGQVTTWRVDDLSDITGAPPITGQLAVTLTPWGGINLTGLDSAGNLVTTWWVPGGAWTTNNLTEQFHGSALASGNVTGYTTPWGGLNYAGLAPDGTITVYWWAPTMDHWDAVPLLPDTVPPANRPAGPLTSSSSAAGTLSVYGSSATGDVIRLSWQPGLQNWTSENLTQSSPKG